MISLSRERDARIRQCKCTVAGTSAWVHEAIAKWLIPSFSLGNRDCIELFVRGSGGVSVHLGSLSPNSLVDERSGRDFAVHIGAPTRSHELITLDPVRTEGLAS